MPKLALLDGFKETTRPESCDVRPSGVLGSINAAISFDIACARMFLFSVCLSVLTFTSQAQEHVFDWAVSMKLGTANTGDGNLYSTAVDADGNVYTVGRFAAATVNPGTGVLVNQGGDDIYVQKQDVDGNFLWARSYGNTGADVAYGVAVDASGNVYVTGRFVQAVQFDPSAPAITPIGTAGQADIFVLKLNTNGDFEWVRQMAGQNFDVGNAIAVDADGNVYTAGSYQGAATAPIAPPDFDPGPETHILPTNGGTDIFVQKMDTEGNFIWARTMGGTSNEAATAIAVDADKNVYITGSFIGEVDFGEGYTLNAGTTRNIFVSKLDADGSLAWAQSVGSTNHDDGFGIAVDPDGNVYTTGAYQGNNVTFTSVDPTGPSVSLSAVGATDIFVQKMDTDGNVLWARSMGGSGSDAGYAIAVDKRGNVYTTGYFGGTGANLDFDPDPGIVYPLPTSGGNNQEIFIQMIDTDGEFVWAHGMGATQGHDGGTSIVVDGLGNVYTSGRFTGTVDFDPGPGVFQLTAVPLMVGSTNVIYEAYVQKLKPVIKLTATLGHGTDAVVVEDGDVLELIYGEPVPLTLFHNNYGSPVVTVEQDPGVNSLLNISGPGAEGEYTLTGIRVNGTGEEGTLKFMVPAMANLNAAELEFKIKINHRPITITTPTTTKPFGEPDPAFTYTVSQGSLVSGHLPTGVLSRDPGESIGSYDFGISSVVIMGGTKNVTSNYEITIDPAEFKIIGTVLTVTATGGVTKSYGSADPAFTYTLSQGTLPAGYSLSGTLVRAPGEDVGDYPFSQGSLAVRDANNNDVSANYTIVIDPNVTFVITPVQLAVAAVAQSKRYGEDDPSLTYTVAGVVNNEPAIDVFTGALQRATGEDAGAYPINRNTLTLVNSNYTWNPNSFISADFTIHKALQQIDLVASEEVQLNAGRLPLTVSSSSGLPVTLVVNNPVVATVSGSELVLHSAGMVTVTVTQEGNHNFEPAPTASATVRVVDPKDSPLIKVHTGLSPNGDGINDFLRIENIVKYPDNQITIFDRSGSIITEIVGYDNSEKVFTGESVPDGTYFYRLGITISGERQFYQGFIVVKKNK